MSSAPTPLHRLHDWRQVRSLAGQLLAIDPGFRVACMGGWCNARGRCMRYHAPGLARLRAEERLCTPGGTEAFVPITTTTTASLQ